MTCYEQSSILRDAHKIVLAGIVAGIAKYPNPQKQRREASLIAAERSRTWKQRRAEKYKAAGLNSHGKVPATRKHPELARITDRKEYNREYKKLQRARGAQ